MHSCAVVVSLVFSASQLDFSQVSLAEFGYLEADMHGVCSLAM